MSPLLNELFTWLGISYTVLIVLAGVVFGVARFYDRMDARIRRRLGRENQRLKARVAELEARIEQEEKEE